MIHLKEGSEKALHLCSARSNVSEGWSENGQCNNEAEEIGSAEATVRSRPFAHTMR